MANEALDTLAAVRVALIRGALLRRWELPNYVLPQFDVTCFASWYTAAQLNVAQPPVRGLPSLADTTAKLGPRAAGAVELVAGSIDRLIGLERALRGFDIAHALELVYPVSLQAIRARDRGWCRRAVITVMDNIPFNPPANALVRRRVERVARGIDHAIAITERARLRLETAGVPPERITVLPLGIDMSQFRPAEPGPPGSGPMRVLSVARLEPAKGVEDLVIAIGLATRAGQDLHLTLLGEGPLRERLLGIARAMGVADRVDVRGGVTWPAVAEVYREHDVFVLASAPTRTWREQFGFAAVEAMASGLPVLVGDSGSLPEVVGRPESLVRPHDPIALAEHLARLAGDPDLCAEQGRLNRRWAVERYDIERIRQRLRDLYLAVLEQPSAARPGRSSAA